MKATFTRQWGQVLIEVEVFGETVDGLRAEIDRVLAMQPKLPKPTIHELESILREKDGAVEILPNGEVRVQEEPEPPVQLAAYMEIERVKIQAKATSAVVRIWGGTPTLITGWWMTLGHNGTAKFLGATLGPYFDKIVEKDKKRFDNFRAIPRGPKNAVVFYQLFDFSAAAGVKGFEDPIQIPPETLLCTLHFELPAGFKGTHIVRHGGSGIANRPTIYTDNTRSAGLPTRVEHGGISVKS